MIIIIITPLPLVVRSPTSGRAAGGEGGMEKNHVLVGNLACVPLVSFAVVECANLSYDFA